MTSEAGAKTAEGQPFADRPRFRASFFQLSRIWDHEFDIIRHVMRRILLPVRWNTYDVSLPAMLVGGESMLGPSSTKYDPDKQGFAYPALFDSEWYGGTKLRHVVGIIDHRGGALIQFYELHETRGPGYTQGPTPGRPGLDIRGLNAVEDLLLAVICQRGRELEQTAAPFYRAIRADAIIYGLENGRYFSREFDAPEEWEAEVQRLQTVMKEPMEMRQRTQAKDVLDLVAGGSEVDDFFRLA